MHFPNRGQTQMHLALRDFRMMCAAFESDP